MGDQVLAEHHALLAQSFELECSQEYFSPAELQILKRYGAWLAALASGAISPVTAAQERFVKVARGDARAQSEFEKIWESYIAQLAILATPHYEVYDKGEAWFSRSACWVKHAAKGRK